MNDRRTYVAQIIHHPVYWSARGRNFYWIRWTQSFAAARRSRHCQNFVIDNKEPKDDSFGFPLGEFNLLKISWNVFQTVFLNYVLYYFMIFNGREVIVELSFHIFSYLLETRGVSMLVRVVKSIDWISIFSSFYQLQKNMVEHDEKIKIRVLLHITLLQ